MLIDAEEESVTGSNYLCELCDAKFNSKQAISIHKHRKHGLQLLIEANSLPRSATLQSKNKKLAPFPKAKQTPVVQELEIINATPTTVVADVSNDDDMGDSPSPSYSPLPMEVEEDRPLSPEPATKSTTQKKTGEKKSVVIREKIRSPEVAKKSTVYVNPKPKRKSALKAQRELKKLETNSSMRISDDELEEISTRKRRRSGSGTSRSRSQSSSINEFVAPRKAAVNAEKKIKSATKREERNSMSDPEDEPTSKRKCEDEEPEMKPRFKPIHMNGGTSSTAINVEENSLLDDKGRLECIYCFMIIHVGRYCAHMRKAHPGVDEFSWQVKPGEVDEIQTPIKEELEVTKVKTEASSASRDLSTTLENSERESFVCNICDKTFNKRIALSQHIKKVHKMNYCCDEAYDDDAFQDHSVLHDLEMFDKSVEVADNTEETEAALAVFSAPLAPKSTKENVKPKEEASPQIPAPSPRGRKAKSKSLDNVIRDFSCTKCIFKGSENDVYDHYRHIHRLFWCFTCKETFEKLIMLENHFNEQHIVEYKEILDFYDRGDSNISEWTCKSCKQPFKNKSRMLQHCKVKHSLLPCFICTAAFKTQEQLQHHSDLCEKKTCSYCSERFTHKIMFLLHELQHVDDGDIEDFRAHKKEFFTFAMQNSKFRCISCKLAFSTEQLHERHIQKIHLNSGKETEKKAQPSGRKSSPAVKASTCNGCDITFSHPRYLLAHKCPNKERAASDDEEDDSAAFKCEVCKQSFASSEILRNHLEVHAKND